MIFDQDDLKLDPADFPLDWETYDEMFVMGEQFSLLKRICFQAFGKVDGDVAEMKIKRLFSSCDAKGLLCFTCNK